jgi:hypothetical protein
MNIYESLLAKAINGGGGSDNPNSITEVNATLENPWGTNDLASQYMTAYDNGDVSAVLEFDATALGFGTLWNPIDSNSCEGCFCGYNGQGEPDGSSLAYVMDFSTGDSVGNLIRAFVVQNGTVTNMKPYASVIPTKLTIYWHPMP